MALEHSAEVDTIIGGIDEGIAHCLRSDLEGLSPVGGCSNSAEGSANDAMAIEFPNTSWLQRNVAGGDKFSSLRRVSSIRSFWTDRRFDWPDVLRLPSSHLGCGRPDCVAGVGPPRAHLTSAL